ncbi:MAG: flagellar basal body L-ring protein FlgH [Armatimonadota bacterium]
MTTRARTALTGALAVLVAASLCPAEPADIDFFTSLYLDHRAARPGNIVFVVISESAMASHTASRSNQSASEVEVGPGTGWLDFIPQLGFGGELQATASGQSQRRDSLSARIAAVVTGISPTGNLIIEGERTVRVNHDLQTIRLIGEVRPQDVRPDNTVLSQHVANAAIEYQGPDPARPARRVGIIPRVLSWLF